MMKIAEEKSPSDGLMSALRRTAYFPTLLLIVVLMGAVVSCSGSREERKSEAQASEAEASEAQAGEAEAVEPQAKADDPCQQTPDVVEYFDSMGFDQNLSVSLKCNHPEVTVKFPLSVNIYRIPDRVDKWFYMVGKYEGAAKPEIENEGRRSLLGEAISLVIGVYDVIKEKVIYSSAKNYNATIYYKEGTGTVTRVVFTRKPDKESPPEK